MTQHHCSGVALELNFNLVEALLVCNVDTLELLCQLSGCYQAAVTSDGRCRTTLPIVYLLDMRFQVNLLHYFCLLYVHYVPCIHQNIAY